MTAYNLRYTYMYDGCTVCTGGGTEEIPADYIDLTCIASTSYHLPFSTCSVGVELDVSDVGLA
jgi:hypothetical protein